MGQVEQSIIRSGLSFQGNKKNWVGIDNGVSGSIGMILYDGCYDYIHTPIKRELNYTKSKQFLNRVDVPKLIQSIQMLSCLPQKCFALLERPLVNPRMFRATISAIRALEATIIAFEVLKIPYQYCDSKEWQKEMLPSGLEGKELKVASLQVGKRLFPNLNVDGFADCDGILIAEYGRRKGL